MRALVIDDAKTIRLALKLVLRQIGFTVSEAADGRAGLEQLARMDRPDVVFVDCFMPEMDGYKFIRAVRVDARYGGLRLIMLSAVEDPAAQARALEAGADAFLTKQFSYETVQTTLEQLGLTTETVT